MTAIASPCLPDDAVPFDLVARSQELMRQSAAEARSQTPMRPQSQVQRVSLSHAHHQAFAAVPELRCQLQA